MNSQEFRAGPNDSGKRIDRILRKILPSMGLSQVYRAIRTGDVIVNGSKAKLETRLREGDRILVRGEVPTPSQPERAKHEKAKPPLPDIRSSIIFENEDFLAINKQSGITSQGEGGADEAVKLYLEGSIPASLGFQPGPLHRLDRNTSGVLCFSKSIQGAREGSAAFHDHRVKKYYVGILDGELAAAGQWIDSLARLKNERRTIKAGAQGKKAVTFVFPLMRRDGHSLCFFSIQTGRTHQIRTQAALQGHPLSGDRKYGSATAMDRYVLHCLAVVFPQDGQVDFPPPLIAGLPRDSERETLRIFGASSLGLIEEAVRKALPG